MGRRTIGIAMLVVEATLLWKTMGYRSISGLAIMVALIGYWPWSQLNWGYRIKYVTSGMILALYLGWWWLDLQHLTPSRSAQFDRNLSLALALGLMMVQAQQYFWRNNQGLPGYYPFLGAMALAFAADNYLSPPDLRAHVFGLAMSFGFLMGLFYAAGQERNEKVMPYRLRRYTLLGICFLLSLLLAAGTAWVLGNSDRVVARWMAKRMGDRLSTLGNQQTARLNSMTDIKGKNFDHIALQIVADTSPGYLRGQVYGKYNGTSWSALTPGSAPSPVDRGPDGYTPVWHNENLYPVTPEAKELSKTLVVYPDSAIDRAMFTPKTTGWAGLAAGKVMVNEAQVVQAVTAMHGQPYQVLTASNAPMHPLSEEERILYTKLPTELATRLKTLAASICGNHTTTLGKANSITQYFTANYDYVLGIEIPKGANAMEYFLFSDPLPDAHCEFFATGAALLLRAVGVPTRYVTGVGVWEQHPFADYWVARNRDAHAWVEAWDEDEGWFIVEATPASGLPEAGQDQGTNRLHDFWSMIALQVKRLLTALKEGAWLMVANLLRTLLLGIVGFIRAAWWMVLLLVAGGVAVWILLRKLRQRRLGRPTDTDVQTQRMQTQLSTMDRWILKKHRLTRQPHVTLHSFAKEIEENLPEDAKGSALARWYRQWAATRYQPQVADKEITALEAGLQKVQRRKG